MAFCFSGSLLRANFNIVSSCLILLLFVANKFLLLLLIAGPTVTQNLPFLPQRWPKPPPLLVAATHRRMARLSLPEWPGKYRDGRPAESCHRFPVRNQPSLCVVVEGSESPVEHAGRWFGEPGSTEPRRGCGRCSWRRQAHHSSHELLPRRRRRNAEG